MKQTVLSRALRRAVALGLAAALTIPAVYATAGDTRLKTTRTIAEGLTYINTISQHTSGRMESYALEVAPDSRILPVMMQSSDTVYGTGTINTAVKYAESLGYNVLGAINGDFFNWGHGVPVGISLEDGVYRSSPDGRHAIAVVDGALELIASPVVTTTLVHEPSGTQVNIDHFNKWRDSSGGMYLYNEDFSTVSTHTDAAAGRMVRMEVVPEDQDTPLTANSTLTLEVTEVLDTPDAVPIGEDNYIMTAAYESGFYEVFAQFQVGDSVTLSTVCNDPVLSAAQWASGCGDIMVWDGAITDSSTWGYPTGRDPRSAVGVKADGTMVFYEVDGRQSSHSQGLREMELAQELQAQGCVWAVNLDGGGSSALSVRLPGQSQSAVVSSPSGGALRGCATYLLLVSPEPGDGVPEWLALKEDGLVVLTGSSLPLGDVVALDNGSRTVVSRVSDVLFASQQGLGTFNGSLYTAGQQAGTDTVRLMSPQLGVAGDGQIHVVSTLSQLTVTQAGKTTPLERVTLEVGESISLSASGTYWGRTALRPGTGGVSWSVEGDVGTITQEGVFTATGPSHQGNLVVQAGGLEKKIPVTIRSIHNDVGEDHWAYDGVEYCYDHGIVSGVSPTEFGVDQQILRGDFVLMVYNALGKPEVTQSAQFADVQPTDYYATAIAWASENGLVAGAGEGLFAPREPVTREQALSVLCKAMELLDMEPPQADLTLLDGFADKDLIAEYARANLAIMVEMGLVSGDGVGINPRGPMTRGELAVVLYRLMTYEERPLTPEPKPEQPDPEQPDPEQPVQPGEGDHLTLNITQAQIAAGSSLQLEAIPSQEGAAVTWTSSDTRIAQVDDTGLVTNLYTGTGTATVTITATWGGLTATATLSCLPAATVGEVNAQPSLNVRDQPSLEGKVLTALPYGSRVLVVEHPDLTDWYQVRFAGSDGQMVEGFVSAQYLTLLTDSNG